MNFDDGCYVIAEIGVNHNGSVDIARELIDVAAVTGADAVKFQSFSADDLVTRRAGRAEYQSRNIGEAGTQHSMLRALELSESDFSLLMRHCNDREIDFLSTPFGIEPANMLQRIGVGAFKVSSGDLTHHPLLAHLSATGLPIILSTGMATLSEVEEALDVITRAGTSSVAILHCVSDYPAAPDTCNLAAMATIRRAFGRPVGWSDHTTGTAVAFAAVALGATLIEKHITLDVEMDGPDHAASMTPDQFAGYVAGIRSIQEAIGDGIKRPSPQEAATAEVARRSIIAARDLPAGHVMRSDDIAIKRPGTGLAPKMLELVVGARLARSIVADEVLTIDHLHG